jgi:preprotein translocase subunit YajC
MQLPNMPDTDSEADVVTPAAVTPPTDSSNQYGGTPKPITEVVVQPDFPKSALGELIEIGGQAGIVIEIVNQSLKVRFKEGTVQSFNGNVLRKLYAPAKRPAPTPMPLPEASSSRVSEVSDETTPSRDRGEDEAEPEAEMVVDEAKYKSPARPISEFVTLADYPKCLLGEHVDIGGFTGVVVELADKSLKVKPRHGVGQRFNANVLKRVYGPQPKPVERSSRPTYRNPAPVPAAEERPRQVITEPDFNAPVNPITEYITREDYPQCTFGAHVEITGFTGVVVEIVKGSLKVKSHDGLTRSYNSQVLRKLYA